MGNALLTLRCPAEREQLSAIKLHVCASARQVGWRDEDLDRLELVLEEAVMNIISYSYVTGRGDLQLELHVEEGEGLRLLLQDWGVAFDPTNPVSLDCSVSLEERSIGGLGLHLMQTLTDNMRYYRQYDSNLLELILHKRPMVDR